MPKTACFSPSGQPPPEGMATFMANDRVQRVAMWLNQNFLLTDEVNSTVMTMMILTMMMILMMMMHR